MFFIRGDLFSGGPDKDAICIPTNGIVKLNKKGQLVAVMGAGVAKQAQQKWPGAVDRSLANMLMENGHHTQIIPMRNKGSLTYELISFPTKFHWKQKSSLDLIRRSAKELVDLAAEWPLYNIYLPPVGTGLGGLDINNVVSVLQDEFREDDRFTLVDSRGAL